MVRSASGGTLLGSVGSSVSPAACVTGTTLTTFSFGLASVTNTDTANDLRIRVYGRDSGSAAWTLDAMTVAGSPGFSTYVLYPFQLIDTADGASRTTRWGPAGP